MTKLMAPRTPNTAASRYWRRSSIIDLGTVRDRGRHCLGFGSRRIRVRPCARNRLRAPGRSGSPVRKGSGPRRGLLAAGEAGDAGDVGGGLAQPAIRLEGVASEAVVAILLEIDAQRGAARPGAGQAVH